MATVMTTSRAPGETLLDIRNTGVVGTSPLSATIIAAMASNNLMDTQLATLNAGYYTAAKLQEMNYNDKVYALRLGYDAAGIG